MTTMVKTINSVSEPHRLSSATRQRVARKRRRIVAPFLFLVSLLPFVFLWWVFVNNYHYLLLPLPWISEWLYIHADIVATVFSCLFAAGYSSTLRGSSFKALFFGGQFIA